MDKLIKLVEDIGKLIVHYYPAYLTGIRNTLILAIAATVAGCIIGLVCGLGSSPIDFTGITCEATGDKPETVNISVSGSTVTVELTEE